ncbi:hypothetical protein H0H93_009827 [Arthromyces matolae]|nr:hypothetical protein H0H93_009827 [Arthromyces matolae]
MPPPADDDQCARNPDGTLKDPDDISWLNSPTDEHPINSTNDISDIEELPRPAGPSRGLKGKAPAMVVAGKRIRKPSKKVRQTQSTIDSIFNKVFTVGKKKAPKLNEDNATTSSQGSKKNSRKRANDNDGRTLNKRARTSQKDSEVNDGEDSDQLPELQQVDDGKDDGYNSDEEEEEEEDPMEVYERMRKQANDDRVPKRKHAPRTQDTRTEDIRGIFRKETREIDGEEINGSICKVCEHLEHSNPFFRGSNSTLRTHIARNWETHGETYMKVCEALSITPSSRAMPPDTEDNADDQTTLDGLFEKVPTKWTGEGLLDHIVAFIVSDDQRMPPSNLSSASSIDSETTSTLPTKHRGYGASWVQDAIKQRLQNEVTTYDPHKELNDYLNSPLETDVIDPVQWWGVRTIDHTIYEAFHSSQYPTLSRMARDYLAIQGSSVPSERAFSSGALTDTLQRNQLAPETFEALQILKNGYNHGVITANEANIISVA